MAVSGIANATGLALGYQASCALLADGTVRCWGRADQGQLGDGTTGNRSSAIPVEAVSGVTTVADLAAGGHRTCARAADGLLRCWGDNYGGKLGNASQTLSALPVVAAVLRCDTNDGICSAVETQPLSPGDCRSTSCGDGRSSETETPSICSVDCPSLTLPTTLGSGRTCYRRASDGLWRCWGYNGSGQLGDGTTVSTVLKAVTPAMISAGAASDLAFGDGRGCARYPDGTAR